MNSQLNSASQTILLRFILVKVEDSETDLSQKYRKTATQQPIVRLKEYYQQVVNGLKRTESGTIAIGSESGAQTLGPNLGVCESGQWLDMHRRVMHIESKALTHNEVYPKCISGAESGAWLAIVGQNGVIIADKSSVVVHDPIVIVRHNGETVVLDDGYQRLILGPGGHLALRGYGVVVLFEGWGRFNEPDMIYQCIRPQSPDANPTPLNPILHVYPGKYYHICQVKQRLILVSATAWEVVLSEHFFPFEFESIGDFFRILTTEGLQRSKAAADQNSYLIPSDFGALQKSFVDMGVGVDALRIVQLGPNETTAEVEIFPRKGELLVVGNCNHLPSTVVVKSRSESVMKFSQNNKRKMFVMTATSFRDANDCAHNLEDMPATKAIILDADGGKCHVCLLFSEGIILMVGANSYSHH